MRVAAVVFTAIIVALAGAQRPAAADQPAERYTVAPHDTAYSIARRFGVSLAALARLNGLADPSKLRAGTVLRIPSTTTAPPPPSGTSPLGLHGGRPPVGRQEARASPAAAAALRTTAVRPPLPPSRGVPALGLPGPAAPAAGEVAHVVQPGDTVYHLAVTHGITATVLEAANRLPSDRIVVGQVLRIPAPAAGAGAAPGRSGVPGAGPGTTGRGPVASGSPAVPGAPGVSDLPDAGPFPGQRPSSLGTPPWSHVTRPHDVALGRRVSAAATRYLGTPYVWGGTGPSGVDCSGLVYLVYAPYLPHMPRSSYDQWRMGDAVDRADLAPGDLVFFDTDGTGASHVGIYIGGGQFVHPAASAARVVIDRLDGPYYVTHYLGARRVL